MDNDEARTLLRLHVQKCRTLAYADLASRVDSPATVDVAGPSGAKYQVETDVLWDRRPGGDVRVICSIDDGGLRALAPISEDFIKAGDGSFVGE